MSIHADRFNRLFALRWRRIADFLKLHYVLSRRDEPYWRAQREPATISPELAPLLELWRDQPPSAYDFPLAEEIFPAASHQYVYYGMSGRPEAVAGSGGEAAIEPMQQVRDRARQLNSALPANRAYLDRLRNGGAASALAREAV
jgi:tryptophan halogenase